MKRLIATGLVSGVLLLVGGCGNSGYGTVTGQADLTKASTATRGPTRAAIRRHPALTRRCLSCPAVGILPYPFDLYFAGSTDGTLNIQPPNPADAEPGCGQRARWLLDHRTDPRALRRARSDPASTFAARCRRIITVNTSDTTDKAPVTKAATGGKSQVHRSPAHPGCRAATCRRGRLHGRHRASDDPTPSSRSRRSTRSPPSTCLPRRHGPPRPARSPTKTMARVIWCSSRMAITDCVRAGWRLRRTPTTPTIKMAVASAAHRPVRALQIRRSTALCQLTGAADRAGLAQTRMRTSCCRFNPSRCGSASFDFSTEVDSRRCSRRPPAAATDS